LLENVDSEPQDHRRHGPVGGQINSKYEFQTSKAEMNFVIFEAHNSYWNWILVLATKAALAV